VSQCPYFFILAVPNQFRYPVWGQEPGSLMRRHRRLLTHERIFAPSYYFTVGTNGNAVRCYILFQLASGRDHLHTNLFIPTYQTQL